MPKPVLGPRSHTHPLIWCAAVICTVLAVSVIITGLIVFVGYEIIHPNVPSINVKNAYLDRLSYDQAGLLTTRLIILIQAENDNSKAHASFYNAGFEVEFLGIKIARLALPPFDVKKNSSRVFSYDFESSPIPLNPYELEYVDKSVKMDKIVFTLKGHAKTRWRVGVLGSVKFWCYLGCDLRFRPSNKTYIRSNRCSSKAK